MPFAGTVPAAIFMVRAAHEAPLAAVFMVMWFVKKSHIVVSPLHFDYY
jgi:hypothetical protein